MAPSPHHDGYHLSEDTAVVEFLDRGGDGESRLVMTNLELEAMPLIRFETGDLGVPGDDARCRCGRTLRRLARVEGRIVDCLHLGDGRTVSPYRITCALEQIPGVRRYQVVQHEIDAVEVRVEAPDADRATISEAVCKAMSMVLGNRTTVTVKQEQRLDAPPAGKFRTVESRVTRQAR